MKKFLQFTTIDEVSTKKLVDYVSAASQDVGRRIEKAEPGEKPLKKILQRSGKIGRAKAHIQMRTNEDVSEATVDDKISKVAKIYNAHRALADKARQVGVGKKRDPEAEAHHMKKSHKAFDLMQSMRKKKEEASKANPKPRPKEVDYGAAIAQDYKDQEKKRGIGHVRDHVEMDGPAVSEDCRVCGQTPCNCTHITEISKALKDRYVERATAAHGHYNMARRNTTGKQQEYFARKEANAKKGISRALTPKNEEVEQVLELKTSTLTRYGTKANQSVAKLGGEADRAIDAGDMKTAAKKFTKRDNRIKGVLKARAKIQANAKKK